MNNIKQRSYIFYSLVSCSFALLFLFSLQTRLIVKYYVMHWKTRSDQRQTMVSEFVSRDSVTIKDSVILKTLYSSGNYELYRDEFKERYPDWVLAQKITGHINSPDIDENISRTLREGDNTAVFHQTLYSVIDRKATQYVPDILVLCEKRLFPELRRYQIQETIYFYQEDGGSLRLADPDEIRYIEEEFYIDAPERYEQYMAKLSRKDVFFKTLPEDLRIMTYGILTYFAAISETTEHKEDIGEILNIFFERFIKLPYYLDGNNLNRENLILDRYFVNAYYHYNDVGGYLSRCLDRLNSRKDSDAWLFNDVQDIVSYLGDTGRGLAPFFYPLFDFRGLLENPLRLYLGIEILKEIGFDDPVFIDICNRNFRPYHKFRINNEPGGERFYNAEDEIEVLKADIAGKKNQPLDMSMLFHNDLIGKTDHFDPVLLEEYIKRDICSLERYEDFVPYELSIKRFLIRTVVYLLIHGLYLFFYVRYFKEVDARQFYILCFSIAALSLMHHLLFVWLRFYFPTAGAAAIIIGLIVMFSNKRFRRKTSL